MKKLITLKVLVPTGIFLEQEVNKIIAEAEDGVFCLLPSHIDFVAGLVPGVLSFGSTEQGEEFLGLDEGVLVKYGSEVLVSTKNAVRSPDLQSLKQTIDREFLSLDDQEKKARSAASKLEAKLVRGFLEMGKHG